MTETTTKQNITFKFKIAFKIFIKTKIAFQ